MQEFSEIELFDLLKKAVTNRYFESNSASSSDISEWKGQDIVSFQEDVFDKTKSTLSEKWFYTYFKSEFKKLPRIDMLNILSQYAGYSGWADFSRAQTAVWGKEEGAKAAETSKGERGEENRSGEEVKKRSGKRKTGSRFPWVGLSVILIGLAALGVGIYYSFFHQKTYEFCFIDADRNSLVTEPIEITIDRKGFTPLELFSENGCIEFSSFGDTLLMSIKSTYYKQDTFKINLHLYQGKENIRLIPDDYKVMLRHYSKSSQSVKERIKMLDEMIANNALIYQVYDNEFFGVEVLSKQQYINLVSLPTTSLKNYTLIEAERKSGKIVKIKFKINSDED